MEKTQFRHEPMEAKPVVRRLVKKDDPVLRERAAECIVGGDYRQLAWDMVETMVRGRGVGLAAPQVGESLRLIVGACRDRHESWQFILLNPVVTHYSKHRFGMREGCLSLPGLTSFVRRPKNVKVTAYDLDWNPVDITAGGLLARVLQHEIEHLDGVLMTDTRH